ncbi:hypothetical protein C9374_003094 [Naegleria lovaniensis]|uniref:Uncharacterized protein n=1 Tax=Naegleria lovaniensis TaxID=51637 RepID=A0AA88KJS6_NAELO|nr:uncharacterized protein C9374_003094 [Naegleria lovaniensis]KAG2385945.1 hypothetical protein C9374_003094 [Naegleria lovaniensis]
MVNSSASTSSGRHQSPLFRKRTDLSISIENNNNANERPVSLKSIDDDISSPAQSHRSKGRYLSPMSKSRVVQMENEIYDDVLMQSNNSLIYERLFNAMEKERSKIIEKEREKKWNSRFHLDPMPSYNVLTDKHAKMYTTSTTFLTNGSTSRSSKKTAYDVASSRVDDSLHKFQPRKVTTGQQSRKKNTDKSILSDQGTKTREKPPLEQKKSLAEIETEQFFLKAKSRIQKLWSELRVPEEEREKFSKIYLSKCLNDNLAIISEEIKRLTEQRHLILSILKNIENRELLLETLNSLVERYGDEKIFSKHLVAREVKNIAASLRLCTLDIVEAIVHWRNILQAPKPFVWRSKNYLLKIQTDLDFFLKSSLVSLLPNINPVKNPFLMSGVEFGISPKGSQLADKKSQLSPTNANRKRPKFDPSPYLNSASLPPLSKLRQSTPGDNDPLRERILFAQSVVFSEGRNSGNESGEEDEYPAHRNHETSHEKVTISPMVDESAQDKELERRMREEHDRIAREEEIKRKEEARRKREEKLREEQRHYSSLIIQAVVRGCKARMDMIDYLRKEKEKANSSAVKIQSQVRMHLAKKKVESVKKEKQLVTCMQALIRRILALNSFKEERLNRLQKEEEIKEEFDELTFEHSMLANYDEEEESQKPIDQEQPVSAELVSLNKSEAQEIDDKEMERKREQASIKIQSQIRLFLATKKASAVAEARKRSFELELEQERREYEKAKQERKQLKLERATLNIQTLWRACSARRASSELKKQNVAAVKIQCMVRQRLSRAKVDRTKKQKQEELERFLEEERKMYADVLNSI